MQKIHTKVWIFRLRLFHQHNLELLAGLEPATSAVTGRRSNLITNQLLYQLSHSSKGESAGIIIPRGAGFVKDKIPIIQFV